MVDEEIKKPANMEELTNIIRNKTVDEIAEFFVDYQKFALNQKFEGIVLELYQGIIKIRILEGVLPIDPVICEFHIKMTIDNKVERKILRVPAEKMSSPKIFKEQYFREFKRLIIIKTNNWHELVNALMKDKSEIVKCLEESEDVMAAREIFDKIKVLTILNDKNKFLATNNNQYIYHENGRYFVLSRVIKEIIEDYSRKISPSRLSKAMYELGMKTEGSQKIDSNHRCWEFLPSALFEKS
jgi:hypothetical protein